ncbi:hypothetical protein ACJJTC_009737 [Scirpophaga incertulas]
MWCPSKGVFLLNSASAPTVKKQESTLKLLLNKNTDIINKNKNLELRIAALEQHSNELDQKLLANTLEIAGIPEAPHQDIKELMTKIADKLQLNAEDIVTARCLQSPKDRPHPGHIIAEVKSNSIRMPPKPDNVTFTYLRFPGTERATVSLINEQSAPVSKRQEYNLPHISTLVILLPEVLQ